MRTIFDAGLVLAAFVVGTGVFVGAAVGLTAAGVPFAVPVVVYLVVMLGWMAFAFVRYRIARQDEMLQVLTSAVELNLPLAPAVRAYLHERPDRMGYSLQLPIAVLLTPVLPGFVVFWFLFWRTRYDRRVGQFVELLEDGVPLADALAMVRPIAPRVTRLAAAVAEETGDPAGCLRGVERERTVTAWLELIPRVLYPLCVYLIVLGITSFLMLIIMPKFKRIFQEFGQTLPPVTQNLNAVWIVYQDFQPLIALLAAGAAAGVALVLVAPGFRWHLPVVGRLYRWEMQAEVLRLLAAQLAAGRTAPQSLDLLADAGEYPPVVRSRLSTAADAVSAGVPLADALRAADLLPAAMVPLVTTAERTRTLPRALAELAAVQSGRAVRLVRRVSLVVSPVLLLGVGAVVAFVSAAMFFPLITLLTELGQ